MEWRKAKDGVWNQGSPIAKRMQDFEVQDCYVCRKSEGWERTNLLWMLHQVGSSLFFNQEKDIEFLSDLKGSRIIQ